MPAGALQLLPSHRNMLMCFEMQKEIHPLGIHLFVIIVVDNAEIQPQPYHLETYQGLAASLVFVSSALPATGVSTSSSSA